MLAAIALSNTAHTISAARRRTARAHEATVKGGFFDCLFINKTPLEMSWHASQACARAMATTHASRSAQRQKAKPRIFVKKTGA